MLMCGCVTAAFFAAKDADAGACFKEPLNKLPFEMRGGIL
jgi:hypothetical protein